MICYKDMTFCPFYKSCKISRDCSRPLTPEVIRLAKHWWGGEDAPICQFTEKPDCFESIGGNKNEVTSS